MTSTLAASGVRDLTPLAVRDLTKLAVSHDQKKQHQHQQLQQRYDDYDTVGIPLHQQPRHQHLVTSSGDFDRINGNHGYRYKQNNVNNNSNDNLVHGKNKNVRDKKTVERNVGFKPRSIHKNGGVGKAGGPRRRGGSAGSASATTTNNVTSDYDNVVPSPAVVVDDVARLSKVEEEEGTGEDVGELLSRHQQQPGGDEDDDDDVGGDNGNKEVGVSIEIGDNKSGDKNKNGVLISDDERCHLGDLASKDNGGCSSSSSSSSRRAVMGNGGGGDDAEPFGIEDTVSERESDERNSHVLNGMRVSDQRSGARARACDDVSGEGVDGNVILVDERRKSESGDGDSRNGKNSGVVGRADLSNGDDDDDDVGDAAETKPAVIGQESGNGLISSNDFVGKKERLLNGEKFSVGDSGNNNTNRVGIDSSSDISTSRPADGVCDRVNGTTTYTTLSVNCTDSENVSVKREVFDNGCRKSSNDCDRIDKDIGSVIVDQCCDSRDVREPDYDNNVYYWNEIRVHAECHNTPGVICKGSDVIDDGKKVECSSSRESRSKYRNHPYSVTVTTVNMGAKQSKRSNAGKSSSAVSYDHGQSKIEMKDLSRNGDGGNHFSNSKNRPNNWDNKNEVRVKVDPIHGEMEEDEKRSLSLDSYQTIPEYQDDYINKGSTSGLSVSFDDRDDGVSSPVTPLQSLSSREDLLAPNARTEDKGNNSETRNHRVFLETEIDPAPIYAVVNKKKKSPAESVARQPDVVDEDLMDGDYSVPTWGQPKNSRVPNQHIVNPGRKHKETVSACVSVSSLASSERGNEKLKPEIPSDDEYDDTFTDPNNRSQMKKSSTSDNMLSEEWKGSLKFPRSQSSSRDYFSLGRRPKVKRSRTLVDCHGKAVSMDTLLKARRRGHSFRAPSEVTTPVDNLSVEDILKSCEDFDASSIGFRSRSESANSMSRSNRNLPFFLVKENDVPEVASRVDKGLNNLNASLGDSNDNPNGATDSGQEMNIVNGEDVELRPSKSKLKNGHSVTSPKFPTVLKPRTQAANSHTVAMVTVNSNNVQSPPPPSSSRDLKTKPELVSPSYSSSSSSSSGIPSSSTTFQKSHHPTANAGTTNSINSSQTFPPPTIPANQTPYRTGRAGPAQAQNRFTTSSSETFQNPPPYSTLNSSNPRPQKLTTTTSSSSSGVFMMSPTSETSSFSISSPASDDNSNQSVTSPFPVFSPPPPSKLTHMTSLTVDVSSPLSEGSTSQNSSPAPRSPNSTAKLEAVEAIKWLRAAGFPQYAQMFDDGLFPIELALVEKDHDFLDKDSIQSLFRRLETLNKYAGMKIDAHQRKKAASEEEEEDDICALSERWEYQKSVRRWSRKDLVLSPRVVASAETTELNTRGSHDSLLEDQDSGSQTEDSPVLNTKMPHEDGTAVQEGVDSVDGSVITTQQPADEKQNGDQQTVGGFPISPRLRRAASERIKTAKNLWKKMEGGLKSKKSRRHPRNIMEISDPVVAVADQENMQAKLQRLNCVDISPSSEQPPALSLNSTKEIPSSPDQVVSSPISTHNISLSPQQLDTSTEADSLPLRFRSRSALESQSVRDKSLFLHCKNHPDKRSSDTLNSHDTQHSVTSTGTDSSLKEFYTAQSQLLKTLEAAHPSSRSSSFRKNSSDTGLMEIFLLPEDHQPGKFPRLLQNGYIETESRGVPSNSRFVRENVSGNLSARLGIVDSAGDNRVSVYDNFSTSSDASRRTADKPCPSLAGIHEDDSKLVDSGSDALYISENSDSSRTDTNPNPQQHSYQELRDKILKEASSPSLPLTEIQSEGHQDPHSPRGVCHSVSVDSYLKDSSVGPSHRRNSSNSSNTLDNNTSCNEADTSQERSLSQQYDEFDLILKEMYANISDLTRRMSEKTEDSTPSNSTIPPAQNSFKPSSTSAAPSSTFSSSSSSSLLLSSSSSSHKKPTRPTLILPEKTQPRHPHHLHTDHLTYDPEGVPVSPNSDPVVSPSSPLSHRLGDESVDTDGVTDPDNENSSSGGADSHTGGSVSDPEGGLDLSHDDSLEQIPAMTRERRDSGVGHSLTRAPSDRRRKKLRWHSFQKCHRPDVSCRSMQINSLTVGQLVWLQKLSLLKLTGIMEKCLPVNKSGWNWMMPRFMKRNKHPDFNDKNVFGVPLSVMAQRTGQPLPQCVLYAMRYLRRTSQHAVGIFRKSGVKSKIQSLIDHLEANPDTTDFEDMNAYNVADMIKTFFRDLPECLLTNKLSETFRSIYTHVPKSQLLEAIQAAILLLPDENREVLQSLLLFLSDISMHEADHQMNATNLAVCFTPTVFMLGFKQTPLSHSPKRIRKAAATAPGVPDPREIMEQKTSQDCLLLMITECKKLFTVPPKLFRQVQVQSLANKDVSPFFELNGDEGNISDEIRAFGQERVQKVLKEAHDKNRGWLPVMTMSSIEISHRKPLDDNPLKEWKMVVDVDAPPIEVLRRIMHERHAWDEDLLSWSVVERIDPHSDIFQYVLNSMAPHPSRHFCVLRYWRTDLSKGACALITMSVDHADVQDLQGVAAIDYGSLYLMEPCGSGRTRLTHVTRMDTRGRCPEWYSKVFGHIVGNFVERLRDSFKQETSGPETKV